MDEALRSDDEIAAVRIGPPDVLDAPIRLVDYDPAWPQLFEREAARIRVALGGGALLIEHAGSTAVPRLAAKPRIDMVLAVADSSDEPSYVPPLEAAGYVLRIREPGWYEHRPHRLAERVREHSLLLVRGSTSLRPVSFQVESMARPGPRHVIRSG